MLHSAQGLGCAAPVPIVAVAVTVLFLVLVSLLLFVVAVLIAAAAGVFPEHMQVLAALSLVVVVEPLNELVGGELQPHLLVAEKDLVLASAAGVVV